MDSMYMKALDAMMQRKIDLRNADLRLLLVTSGYTPDLLADEFISVVAAQNRIGAGVQIPTSGRSVTGGKVVLPSPVAYPETTVEAQGYVIYSNTKDDASGDAALEGERRLIYFNDGKVKVTLADSAGLDSANLVVEALRATIPINTTFSIGGVSVTTAATAARGAFDIPVTPSHGAIPQGATGEASKGHGWPAPLSVGGMSINLGDATNGLFRIFL